MQDPVVISTSPMKPNLIYAVAKKEDILDTFRPLCARLSAERIAMGRTIIFCRKNDEVTTLYKFFKRRLGDGFTHPAGSPEMAHNRLVDMYTHCTHDSVKDHIAAQFTRESPLRIMIATIAFGMGIDCPDVRQVVHWGTSEDVEMYVQESGRAGRDGATSRCLLFHGAYDLNRKRTAECMIRYCKNKEGVCRRKLLFKDFDGFNGSVMGGGCQCCDLCTQDCKCGNCGTFYTL